MKLRLYIILYLCLYFLAEEDESNSDYDEDYSKEAEIRFAPSQGTNVHDLFDCIQDCNRLHPVPNDDG